MNPVDIITSVGFPIFSFIVAGLALKYVYDTENNKNAKLLEAVTEAVQELKNAVTELSTLIKEKEE